MLSIVRLEEMEKRRREKVNLRVCGCVKTSEEIHAITHISPFAPSCERETDTALLRVHSPDPESGI